MLISLLIYLGLVEEKKPDSYYFDKLRAWAISRELQRGEYYLGIKVV